MEGIFYSKKTKKKRDSKVQFVFNGFLQEFILG